MKKLKFLLMLFVLTLSTGTSLLAQPDTTIFYGPESRQYLDIYMAPSDCPTPVYIWAHGNGQSTQDIDTYIPDTLNAMGISVISWESLTAVFDSADLVTAWDDANVMYAWLKANASAYNIDTSNLILGGSSRGSVVSWKLAHSADPNVQGLYFRNAVPISAWSLPTVWTPLDDITVNSPPIFMAYPFSDTTSNNHSPVYGMRVQAAYDSLGIGDRDSLVHSIRYSVDRNAYKYLPDFALSVIEICTISAVDQPDTTVFYGSESRQYLDIYLAPSDCPTPVYLWSHGNTQNTLDIPLYVVDTLTAMGISVISWESLTVINGINQTLTAWEDADLMYAWLKANASAYNIDTTKLIMGGSSRGSVASWKIGHSADPNIRGLYFRNALPDASWEDPNFSPIDFITVNSPPIFLAYPLDTGTTNIHEPLHGITVLAAYDSLGIGDRASLEFNINASADPNAYKYLPDFALSVIEICSVTAVELEESGETVKVFPNPVQGQLTVSNISGLHQIELINAAGQILKVFRSMGNTYTIETSTLPSGLYFLRVLDANNRLSVQKIIKE